MQVGKCCLQGHSREVIRPKILGGIQPTALLLVVNCLNYLNPALVLPMYLKLSEPPGFQIVFQSNTVL